MVTDIQLFNQITTLITKLSLDYRLKLLEFIVKTLKPIYFTETQATISTQKSGVSFLLAVAGQGQSGEKDVSERDEEILAQEIDPIRGWHVG